MASQSAFNNATGALTTLAALAMATGSGDLSFALSSFELVKQLFIGIVAGAVFGYVAALLIAHERLAFLADFAPMVTLASSAPISRPMICRPAASRQSSSLAWYWEIGIGREGSFWLRSSW